MLGPWGGGGGGGGGTQDHSTLSKKLKKKLGFYFRNKSCFPFKEKMSVCYISTDSWLRGCGLPARPLLSSFFSGCFVPRCSEIYNWLYIYNATLWIIWKSCMRIRRKMHWHLLIYKAILCHLPNDLCCFIQRTLFGNHSLRSQSNDKLC